jgi:hypothetical protein
MTMSEARPGEEAWSWIESGDLAVGGCLIFVRGGRPEQVIEAFGPTWDRLGCFLLPS